jgi:osmotically-inducible protein OsmY
MKSIFTMLALLVIAVGCVSHREPTYTAAPVFREDLMITAPSPAPPVFRTPSQQDQDLATSVRHEFDRYGELSSLLPNIDINSDRGVVTLMGSVSNPQEKEMVDALVRNVPGVVKVNNLLRVTESDGRLEPTGRFDTESPNDYFNMHVQALTDDDRVLAQRIMSDLRNDAVMASSVPKVNIFIANGEATLKGIVQTEQQRRAIADTVRGVGGIERVRNELKVQHLPR